MKTIVYGKREDRLFYVQSLVSSSKRYAVICRPEDAEFLMRRNDGFITGNRSNISVDGGKQIFPDLYYSSVDRFLDDFFNRLTFDSREAFWYYVPRIVLGDIYFIARQDYTETLRRYTTKTERESIYFSDSIRKAAQLLSLCTTSLRDTVRMNRFKTMLVNVYGAENVRNIISLVLDNSINTASCICSICQAGLASIEDFPTGNAKTCDGNVFIFAPTFSGINTPIIAAKRTGLDIAVLDGSVADNFQTESSVNVTYCRYTNQNEAEKADRYVFFSGSHPVFDWLVDASSARILRSLPVETPENLSHGEVLCWTEGVFSLKTLEAEFFFSQVSAHTKREIDIQAEIEASGEETETNSLDILFKDFS